MPFWYMDVLVTAMLLATLGNLWSLRLHTREVRRLAALTIRIQTELDSKSKSLAGTPGGKNTVAGELR